MDYSTRADKFGLLGRSIRSTVTYAELHGNMRTPYMFNRNVQVSVVEVICAGVEVLCFLFCCTSF